MSKRTERRAAERASHKTAYQQLREKQSQQAASNSSDTPRISAPIETDLLARAQAFFDTKPAPSETAAISEIQLAANRANALLSTGPVTSEGKAVSSKNALKHALSGKTVLLPTDNAAEYDAQLNNFVEGWKPATEEEMRLIQSMVDCRWRLSRIQRLETGLLLKGQLEFASKFEDRSPLERETLIDVEAYLKYEKSIRNLHMQEARLYRRYEKDQSELTRLQTIRRRQELVTAAEQAIAQPASRAPITPLTRNGFEFSASEMPALPNPVGTSRIHSSGA